MVTRREANEIAERELEKLTEEIQEGIQNVLWKKLDDIRKEDAVKEFLFIRATREALKHELWTARVASVLGSGYGGYVRYLRSKP